MGAPPENAFFHFGRKIFGHFERRRVSRTLFSGLNPHPLRPCPRPRCRCHCSPAGKTALRAASAADKAAVELKDHILVSLGKLEDIGRQAAAMLLAEKELTDLRASDPAARTPEQRRRLLDLERQRASTLRFVGARRTARVIDCQLQQLPHSPNGLPPTSWGVPCSPLLVPDRMLPV